MTNVLRVLHGPVNIGNQPWGLSRAERRLGLKSDLVVNYQTWLGYPADTILGELNGSSLGERWRRARFGWSAPFGYDVLHFYFGRSMLVWDDLPSSGFFHFADLKLAKKLGKKVFMTLQGCDVRIARESNYHNAFTPCGPGLCSAYETCIASLDAKRRELIEDILPLCDKVFYLNPELGRFVPNGVFLPYANVEIDKFKPQPFAQKRRPVIIHAPSDPAIKGTKQILGALEELRSKFEFELVLVQGMSHDDAMNAYQHADLVIDQILAGWYGGLSVEAMAMGKPVACAIRRSDLDVLPRDMSAELPILNLDPGNLSASLDAILRRQSEWAAIGRASRAYVERWHDPDKIARALERLYRDPTSELDIRDELFPSTLSPGLANSWPLH